MAVRDTIRDALYDVVCDLHHDVHNDADAPMHDALDATHRELRDAYDAFNDGDGPPFNVVHGAMHNTFV